MSQDIDLSGQTAIVTGASSGIGRAIAERLGAAGAHVVLGGRTRDAMEQSAQRIEAAGGRASIEVADIRDPASMQALVDSAMAADGHLEIMVNNAGTAYLGDVLGGDPEVWRAMLETNVLALLVGCQAAVSAMRTSGTPGHLINVSSIAALRPDSGVYGATKHAVNVITRSLRNELQDDPIQVTSIMPGLVATNLARNMDPQVLQGMVALSGVEAEIRHGERLPDEVIDAAQAALNEIMLKADDVADAVMYAVSRPAHVDIPEIVIRPNKDFQL